MSDEHANLRDLLPAHALGALDDDERLALERHLADCDSCRAELAAWERDSLVLAEALPRVEPSPLARRRLLSALPAARSGAGVPWRIAAAALLVATLGLGAAWLGARRDLQAARTALVEERAQSAAGLARAGRELAALRDERDALAAAIRSLAAPQLQLARLDGLGGRSASGRAFFDPDGRRAVFTAIGLRPAPAGKTYELWAIAGGGAPIPAGTFDVGLGGVGVVAVPRVSVPAVDVWAVTVEPAGGVPAPTGEMVLASS